ncbi:hypothetical protein [Streptomyces cinereoruber]|uniref:hypothetical protein n=1 Tax=Streptomyces cinereoruber TaxID=67260 RepID=UPI00362E23AC
MAWLDIPSLDGFLAWGGAITMLTALSGAAWRLIRSGVRTGKRMNEFMDDWYGEQSRPGVAERPGMMERVSEIEGRLKRVEHELYPNSGSSLRDAVDQANRRLEQLCGPYCEDPEHPPPPPPPGVPPEALPDGTPE